MSDKPAPKPRKPRAPKPTAEGLRIEYMPLAELLGRQFTGNPKAHDDEAIRGSVERFGFQDPIAIDERTGRMSEGHGRLEALRAMREAGETPPENVRAAPDGADWLVPVVRGASFKSKAELERYIVAHNQTTIAGGWGDGQLLAGILRRAEASNVPARVLGFTAEAMRAILVREHTRTIGGEPEAENPADHTRRELRAPFPYFGGKGCVAKLVWRAFGDVKQYIEPFAGSAAVLLEAPAPASLEVVNDVNRYVANFWRCVKYQPEATAREADYPVSHIDLDARHRWLTAPERVAELDAQLADPEWPGDVRIAGWWVWGQCAWIGSGWCERTSQIPHVGNAGQGVQSQIPHVGNADESPPPVRESSPKSRTSPTPGGDFIAEWFGRLAARLERVRVMHGDWTRCLNVHYGDKGKSAAIFFDPPYVAFEKLYAKEGQSPVALDVARWCAQSPHIRIALCGHVGDYKGILDGWQVVKWSRGRPTYGGNKTTASEAIYFSPACNALAAADVADLAKPEPHGDEPTE